MPKTWRFYIAIWLFRTITFYIGIALVQYLFDQRVEWAVNLLPATGAAAFVTYAQARIRYMQHQRQQRRRR